MDTCKPGGCSRIGCEGGHYCYNPDGTERVMKPLTKEEKEKLNKILSSHVPKLEATDQVKVTASNLLKRLESYDHTHTPSDIAATKALKNIKAAEDRFNRNIKRSYLFEKVMKKAMKFGLVIAFVAMWIIAVGALAWILREAAHYDCAAESTAVLRGCEGYTAYKSQH